MTHKQIVDMVSVTPWLTNTIIIKRKELMRERKSAIHRIEKVLGVARQDAESIWNYILELSVNGICESQSHNGSVAIFGSCLICHGKNLQQ